MNGIEVREIREKLGLDREQFADLLCLSGYQAMMNIETDFRKPSKLTVRVLRFLDDQPKKKALEFIDNFNGYETE